MTDQIMTDPTMTDQVIYERPNLNLWQKLKMYWTHDEIFAHGFKQEFIDGKNKSVAETEKGDETFKIRMKDEQ